MGEEGSAAARQPSRADSVDREQIVSLSSRTLHHCPTGPQCCCSVTSTSTGSSSATAVGHDIVIRCWAVRRACIPHVQEPSLSQQYSLAAARFSANAPAKSAVRSFPVCCRNEAAHLIHAGRVRASSLSDKQCRLLRVRRLPRTRLVGGLT